jgi:ABC-type amino acid transport system permease subunit
MRIAARLRGPIAFWALAGLALLVSHDAVFLVQIGPGERLAATLRSVGHDYWGAASCVLVAMAAIAAVCTVARLARLRRRAATLGAKQDARAARLLPIWIRLAAVVVIGFAIQENVEHFVAHGHLIGAGALVGPEYPLALPVLNLVSFAAALGAALLVGSEQALVAAIEAALRRLRPIRVAVRPPQRIPSPSGSVLARFGAGRAPPAVLRLPS